MTFIWRKTVTLKEKKKIYFLIFFGVSIQLRKVMPLFRHRLVIFCNCDHFLFSLLLSSGLWRHSITGGKDDGSDVNESKCCFFPSHQRMFKVIVGNLCMCPEGRRGRNCKHLTRLCNLILLSDSALKSASITTFSETLCLPPFHLSPSLSSFFLLIVWRKVTFLSHG